MDPKVKPKGWTRCLFIVTGRSVGGEFLVDRQSLICHVYHQLQQGERMPNVACAVGRLPIPGCYRIRQVSPNRPQSFTVR